MGKGIGIFIIFLMIIGIGAFVYYKYPADNKEYSNVSICAKYDKKFIETSIMIDNELINTSKGYELFVLQKGLVDIKNINIEDQNFYEKEIKYNITYNNTRIDIILEKPKYPDIDIDYEDGKIILKLLNGNFEDVKVCVKGSVNYIFIQAEDLEKIEKIKGFEDYEKCYNTDFSIKNNNKLINITYQELGSPTENDYINVSILDYQGNYIIEKIK